jgi:hypothetical protein
VHKWGQEVLGVRRGFGGFYIISNFWNAEIYRRVSGVAVFWVVLLGELMEGNAMFCVNCSQKYQKIGQNFKVISNLF